MAKTVLLTESLPFIINLDGIYLLGYAWLFGMCVIAYRTLPRQQFGALQHKTFPVYFVKSIALSAGLLTIWILNHPDVLKHYARPNIADVAQAYALLTVFLSQSFNYFVIGPMTSKTMFKRHRLEKEEGKSYNESGVSSQMKALNPMESQEYKF
ncbi:uncharacterized protein LACBIDRAFT_321220 [Laccaria bicolor S238N-H82]|uniref:Predicted protein n=1 Tax=Laccaria bicolor (strain S238N-H82 / ATCC MYA-4686) TaxID=486041 RepID=B0CP49_LACBS|nr:uncharacterized protein LACBIDRAFT_321220 [Laccaria bicolor S238N-H82]EDR15417.1 predicted protein [Laccaria bicolor S238N-H82]|eukprot:XP_001873625.1 predicted protein [Laccaria bicolor S238N-H82]